MDGKPWCVREGSKRPTTSCKFTVEVKSKKVFCRHLLIFWLQSRLITPITEGVGYSAFLLRPIHCDVNILKSWHQSDTQLKGHMKRYWHMDSFGVEGHPPRLKGRNYRSISATLMLCVHWNNSVFGLSPPQKSIFPHFSASFVRPRKFNNTRSPSIVFVFVLVLALSFERTSRREWLQHCEHFLYLLLGSDKMFFSASFPSLLDPDNIPFQLCLFFYGGKGCCQTMIHTLNTTSIISLRASRCTLIRASFLFLMLFNSLPLMLFVGNFCFLFCFFFSQGGIQTPQRLLPFVCVSRCFALTLLSKCSGSSPHRSTAIEVAHMFVFECCFLSCVESARPSVTPVPSGRCLPCLLVDKCLFLCKSQTCIVFICIKVICFKKRKTPTQL